jgi:Protein of unknown function (DUF917)
MPALVELTARIGQRVTVVAVSTPDLMRTPEALAVFGFACFGLDVPFLPAEELIQRTHTPSASIDRPSPRIPWIRTAAVP